ncbi:AAA-ATPase At3g50940-like [Salvia miltiorrhiza]|uniref:AAA-ATPase At3g50940-like n=1 Tax=Salvia miltiorrhiza TaxID=226208 RepID=UPI0025AC47E2|nr:AAA-ATPase At3g50940-like [Salvia miltiorrhiza]
MSALSSKRRYPSAKAVLSTVATAMMLRSYARELIPYKLRIYLSTKLCHFLAAFSNETTLIIEEFDGLNKNQLFHAAELYAGSISSPSTRRYCAYLPEKEKIIRVSLGENEEITDEFHKIHVKWRFLTDKNPRRGVPGDYGGGSSSSSVRCLELTFHKKNKNKVIDEYLPYVLKRSEALKEDRKTLKLNTLKSERGWSRDNVHPWQSVNLDHPAKFETLAMDDEMKKMIVDDLDTFLKRKEMYKRVGKAWKRGYLLYGPPGTGKSSLIAAMANQLNFDVYDLELTAVRCNSDLRNLLISTSNRSILVVEDIDASIDLTRRKSMRDSMPHYYQSEVPRVTLSGFLNFIDGLWSSVGDERIIIFTTNHKEKLDPALLRPGRMDVHVHMSYCTPCGLRLLARNYLGITEHELVVEAEGLVASSKVTPAEVAEQLLKSEDPEAALRGLIRFLEVEKERREVFANEECDGIKELVKKVKALGAADADAFKMLIGCLEDGHINGCDSSLESAGCLEDGHINGCDSSLESAGVEKE